MDSIPQIFELIKKASYIYKKGGFRVLLGRLVNYLNKIFPLSRYVSSLILNSVFDRITREDLLMKTEIYYFSDGSNVQIDPPDHHFDPVPERLNKHTGTYYFDSPFVSVINDVDIIGPVGAPLSSKSSVILEDFSARKHKWEEYVHNTASLCELLRYRFFKQSCPDNTVEEACSFLNIQSAGYCDWIQCGMSRFEGLEKYVEETGRYPTIILRPDPSEWVIQYLKLIGYSDDNWIEWDGNPLHVNRFIVPTVATPEFDEQRLISHLGRFDDHLRVMNPNSSRWLRETLVSQSKRQLCESIHDLPNSDKIYISRQKADFRSVSNFTELEKYLIKNGFDICFFENMDVNEQILKISAADLIVAPHGAGLANLVYSSKKVVIELFGEEKRKSTFYLLAKSLEYEYGFMLCDEDDQGLVVDIQKLQKLINKIE